jgi:hypothetical protein
MTTTNNLTNTYNNQSNNIKNNISSLISEISSLTESKYLEKERTVEAMYIETTKLKNKEYALFVGTSILTTFIIIGTYKFIIK